MKDIGITAFKVSADNFAGHTEMRITANIRNEDITLEEFKEMVTSSLANFDDSKETNVGYHSGKKVSALASFIDIYPNGGTRDGVIVLSLSVSHPRDIATAQHNVIERLHQEFTGENGHYVIYE